MRLNSRARLWSEERTGLFSVRELVANTPDGQHELRIVRVLLDLCTEPVDVGINRPIVAFVGVIPNFFEQVLSREDAAGIRSEQSQQVKLFWGEFNMPITNCHLAPDWIDPQIPTEDEIGRASCRE